MSCGKHHDADCAEILARMVFFIDHELADADQEQIQHHLDECAPCLPSTTSSSTSSRWSRARAASQAPAQLRERVPGQHPRRCRSRSPSRRSDG